MNIELVVTIIIAIVPAIVAYLQSKKDKILFTVYSNTNLFNNLDSGFVDIDISYRGKNIEKNLYLLKGYIFYIGNKDIKDSTSKVSIQGPEDSKIIDFSISQKPEGMETNSYINNGKSYVIFDLMKSKEFIYVQALVEVKYSIAPVKDFVLNNVKNNKSPYRVNHRIKDIKGSEVIIWDNFSQIVGSLATSLLIIIGSAFFIFLGSNAILADFYYTTKYYNNKKEVDLYKFYDEKSSNFFNKKRDSLNKIYVMNDFFWKEINAKKISDAQKNDFVYGKIQKSLKSFLNDNEIQYSLIKQKQNKNRATLDINLREAIQRQKDLVLISKIRTKSENMLDKMLSYDNVFSLFVFNSSESIRKINEDIYVSFVPSYTFGGSYLCVGFLALIISLYYFTKFLIIYTTYKEVFERVNAHQRKLKESIIVDQA